MVLGDLDHLQVRADVDEQNASRLTAGQPASACLKGDSTQPIPLRFVRIEPYVVPKVSLTGASTERVDTRVLQVIYSFDRPTERPVYVGQQVDLYVKSDVPSVAAKLKSNRPGDEKGALTLAVVPSVAWSDNPNLAMVYSPCRAVSDRQSLSEADS